MSVGPLVTGTMVKRAFQTVLETWTPSVLAEVVRLHTGEDYDPLRFPIPRSYARLPDDDTDVFTLAEDQFPMVNVSSPGPGESIERDGEGLHHAIFPLHVVCMVRGESWDDTSDSVGVYTAALRVAGAQHRIDVPGAQKARWRAESYDAVASRGARTLGAGIVTFAIPVRGVLDDTAGLAEPPEAPDYPYPEPQISTKAGVSVHRLTPNSTEDDE